MLNGYDDRGGGSFPWRTALIGSIAAVIIGILLVSLITYSRYGGTPFDRFFKTEEKSQYAGKLAFAKGTGYYIGIIRSEGKSRQLGEVFYVEQPGGVLIEVAQDRVEVREP